MTEASSEMRPIKMFGVALTVFDIAAIWFFFSPLSSGYVFTFWPEVPAWALAFLIGVLVFYLLTALGIVLQQRWGYWLLKLCLYLFFPAFPIGTIISYTLLRYIKRHEIKRYFGFTTGVL